MKKLLLFLFLVPALALVADQPVSTLNGAFRQTKNKYGDMTEWKPRIDVTVVKVFRDGYWLGAFYDDKRPGRTPFDGACGGTYEIKKREVRREGRVLFLGFNRRGQRVQFRL